MSNGRKTYVYAVLLAILVSALSTYIHHPETSVLLNIWGFKYNDIVYGVFNPRFSPNLNQANVLNKWYRPEKYYCLTTSSRVVVYPYIDYEFEYPPLIGLIWFISVNLATYIVLPDNYRSVVYRESFDKLITVHYMIHAIVNSLSLVIVTYTTVSMINKIRRKYSKYRCLFYLLPSVIVYLVYNWDILCSLFLILGLKNYLNRKWLYTGLFIGLSISTKILTFFIAMALLISLIKNRESLKNNIYYTAGLTIATAVPFSIMYFTSPRGFHDFINHHAAWYCENCLYQLFTSNIFSPFHKILAAMLITIFVSLTLYLFYSSVLSNLLETSLVLVITTISLNYVFSPQMILLITPLALITLDKFKLLLYSTADFLNALIIILFFEDEKLRIWLNNIGLSVKIEFNPWSITSIVQWIALARILLLLIIILHILISRLKNTKLIIVF